MPLVSGQQAQPQSDTHVDLEHHLPDANQMANAGDEDFVFTEETMEPYPWQVIAPQPPPGWDAPLTEEPPRPRRQVPQAEPPPVTNGTVEWNSPQRYVIGDYSRSTSRAIPRYVTLLHPIDAEQQEFWIAIPEQDDLSNFSSPILSPFAVVRFRNEDGTGEIMFRDGEDGVWMRGQGGTEPSFHLAGEIMDVIGVAMR